MDDLKAWLVMHGFRIAANQFRRDRNECDWYAYRRSNIPARECETNDGKPAQIVVYPSSFTFDGRLHESVEVEVCGEADGVWFKLTAYSLAPADVPAKLPSVEASLIAAWNALIPADGGQPGE